MVILFNADKKFSNITILMTQKEINKNTIMYNGERMNNFVNMQSSNTNFNIQLINKGEK